MTKIIQIIQKIINAIIEAMFFLCSPVRPIMYRMSCVYNSLRTLLIAYRLLQYLTLFTNSPPITASTIGVCSALSVSSVDAFRARSEQDPAGSKLQQLRSLASVPFRFIHQKKEPMLVISLLAWVLFFSPHLCHQTTKITGGAFMEGALMLLVLALIILCGYLFFKFVLERQQVLFLKSERRVCFKR